MARRSTPERIDAAHRTGTRQRLTGEGVDRDRADAWIAAWEAQEPRDVKLRDGAYWNAGWDWIAAERSCGRHQWIGSNATGATERHPWAGVSKSRTMDSTRVFRAAGAAPVCWRQF
jgi:hypothetical protein